LRYRNELERGKTGELTRRHWISHDTFYKWRWKYGGLKHRLHFYFGT